MFTLADGKTVTALRHWGGDPPDDAVDSDTTKLSRLQAGDQFAYTFDLGDEWTHLCTVDPEKIDPLDVLGMTPAQPLAYWGWGDLPDQYGRRWHGDDGEAAAPRRPSRPLADLPAILPWWGPQRRR